MTTESKSDETRLVYLATAVAALGGMLCGYEIGVISGASSFIKTEFAFTSGVGSSRLS